jgi:5-formaminoimidazole-4-carboxamide-1-beta-D-ribofuranosyl 5'-monophosphate synthetase
MDEQILHATIIGSPMMSYCSYMGVFIIFVSSRCGMYTNWQVLAAEEIESNKWQLLIS